MMLVIRILEASMLILAGLFVFTQVIVPAIQGRVLFPLFRREAKLKQEIFEVEQRLHEADVELDLQDARDELADVSKLIDKPPSDNKGE